MENGLDITIRRFEDDDARAVSRLIIDNLMQVNIRHYGRAAVRELANSYSPALLKQCASSGQVYVALEHSDLVGTMTLQQDRVRMVFVRVDRHWHGIGTAMMQYLEETARQQGQARLSLLADISAASFYQKLGYSRVEEKQVKLGDSAVRMVSMEKEL